ncbi:MFS transporter [Brevibacterium samyangense]|uniref:MDR family MFS transporter n=1 Tax=Brevibacterium samyangense TaxID=366888 RepID=A0ABN2T3C2_9MICO
MASLSDVGLRSERGPILLAIMVATCLVAMTATIVATAVPSIVDDLGGYESFPWIFSIFVLAQAVLTPVHAKLADQLGRKPVLLWGIGVFLLASLLCGFAWNMPSLIVFRALQGVGAGAIMPMTVTMLGDIYSVEERARVQGYVASMWGIASVVGPTVGGVFSELGIWRWIFFLNVPLCLLAAWLLVRNYRETVEKRDSRIDWGGAVLLTAALTLLMLGILQGGVAWAWMSTVSIGVFAGGFVLLGVFVLVERRAPEPVIPLWIFTRPVVAWTALLNLVMGGVMIGYTAYVPTYLEGSLGVSPLVAGLALATMTIGWPVAAALSGRVYLRRGFSFAITCGTVCVAVAGVAIAFLSGWPSPWVVGGLLLVTGFGLGFVAAPSLVRVQSSVEWAERGVASGTVMFSRAIGQSLVAAGLGAIANGIVLSRGGDAQDVDTVIASSGAVFWAAAVCGVAMVVIAVLTPSDRKRRARPRAVED